MSDNSRTEWVLVPRVPTAEMIQAGIAAMKSAPDLGGIVEDLLPEAWDCFVAMAGSAPPTPDAAGREALDLLDILFTAYEDGVSCYEDPEDQTGPLGNAVKIDDETFHRCADLLNRERPRTPSLPTPPTAAPEQEVRSASMYGLVRDKANAIERGREQIVQAAWGTPATWFTPEQSSAQPWEPVTDVEVEAMCDAFEATHGTGAQAMAAAGNTLIALRAPPQTQGVAVDEAMARQLDDYLEAEFDIRIGKQSARSALEAALAPQQTEGGRHGVL